MKKKFEFVQKWSSDVDPGLANTPNKTIQRNIKRRDRMKPPPCNSTEKSLPTLTVKDKMLKNDKCETIRPLPKPMELRERRQQLRLKERHVIER